MRKNNGKATINLGILQAAARVMTTSFLEDPLNVVTLTGVKKKKELLYETDILQLKQAAKAGALHLLDGNPKALLGRGGQSEKQPCKGQSFKFRNSVENPLDVGFARPKGY